MDDVLSGVTCRFMVACSTSQCISIVVLVATAMLMIAMRNDPRWTVQLCYERIFDTFDRAMFSLSDMIIGLVVNCAIVGGYVSWGAETARKSKKVKTSKTSGSLVMLIHSSLNNKAYPTESTHNTPRTRGGVQNAGILRYEHASDVWEIPGTEMIFLINPEIAGEDRIIREYEKLAHEWRVTPIWSATKTKIVEVYVSAKEAHVLFWIS